MDENKINPNIFRAYDIRGIFGKDISADVFRKIGFVLGQNKEPARIATRSVAGGDFVVGQDIRDSGQELSKALIEGLVVAGSKVTFTGINSFGETLFAGWQMKKDKTLFVTASHLPAEWNGLKMFYGDGEPFSEKEIIEVRDRVLALEEKIIADSDVQFEKADFRQKYIDFLKERFKHLQGKKIKIVLDCGNGSMSLVAPQVFKSFGFEVVELYCQPDPAFSNRDPEPTIESTKDLREKVLQENADFGVAFDGDGDRGVIIDDKGRYLKGDQIGIIFAKNLLKEGKNNKIIATVACSLALEKELLPLGAKIERVPVGHTFVISNCKEKGAALGLEESSHIVQPQYYLFDDAILTPLKTAQIIFEQKQKLSELVDEIEIYPFEEIKFDCPDEVKFKIIENLKIKLNQQYEKVSFVDGIRIDFDYGWVLLRPSNTSPIIRLYVEAETKKQLQDLKNRFSEILEKEIQK